MKEKIAKNFSLKMASVVFAFLAWLSVTNIANPWKTETQDVVVEIVGADVLEASNLTYEIDGKRTATVSYKVRTKDAYKIKASDFRAYADLSELWDVTGAIPVNVEVLNNSELLQAAPTVRAPGVIKIATEPLQTKSFEIAYRIIGNTEDGYTPGDMTLSPQYVYVKGPTSEVGQISQVGIEVNVEGAVADVTGAAEPVLYDANGNQLTLDDSVEILTDSVTYDLVILKTKLLGLDFVVTGEVADGYRYTGIECDVTSVPVEGLKSTLASLNTILVQDPSLNVEGATRDKLCTIDLNSYLPPNVNIVGMDEERIEVTLKVEALETENISVDADTVILEGMNSRYEYELGSASVEITVRGLAEDLDRLRTEGVESYANVSGLAPGEHAVGLDFNLDDSYELVDSEALMINVSEGDGTAGGNTNGGDAAEAAADLNTSAGNASGQTEDATD